MEVRDSLGTWVWGKKNLCHWSGSSGHVTDFEEVRKYKSGVTANSGDMRVVSSVWKPATMSMTSL